MSDSGLAGYSFFYLFSLTSESVSIATRAVLSIWKSYSACSGLRLGRERDQVSFSGRISEMILYHPIVEPSPIWSDQAPSIPSPHPFYLRSAKLLSRIGSHLHYLPCITFPLSRPPPRSLPLYRIAFLPSIAFSYWSIPTAPADQSIIAWTYTFATPLFSSRALLCSPTLPVCPKALWRCALPWRLTYPMTFTHSPTAVSVDLRDSRRRPTSTCATVGSTGVLDVDVVRVCCSARRPVVAEYEHTLRGRSAGIGVEDWKRLGEESVRGGGEHTSRGSALWCLVLLMAGRRGERG